MRMNQCHHRRRGRWGWRKRWREGDGAIEMGGGRVWGVEKGRAMPFETLTKHPHLTAIVRRSIGKPEERSWRGAKQGGKGRCSVSPGGRASK